MSQRIKNAMQKAKAKTAHNPESTTGEQPGKAAKVRGVENLLKLAKKAEKKRRWTRKWNDLKENAKVAVFIFFRGLFFMINLACEVTFRICLMLMF